MSPRAAGGGERAGRGSAMTWEPYVAGAAVLVVLAAAALPIGQGFASLVTLNGWVWPHVIARRGTAPLVSAIIGLLTGRPGVGLDPAQRKGLPPASVTYTAIVATEAAAAAGAYLAIRWIRRVLGGGDGWASAREAEDVLGRARLDRTESIIRPDLHDRRRERRRGRGQ